jgi:predicted MFS family arabinose efflux permease
MTVALEHGVHPARLHRGAILALAFSTFVYVTSETLPVGLLPQISDGLHTSQASVGLLLTSYAIVAGASAIPLTALTMRVPRNLLIVACIGVFSLSQLAAAFAPTFALLIISRLLCALAHGIFWSAVAPAAARLAPRGQGGHAMSLVFVGGTAALVVGVPLTTLVGQLAGWRTAFLALAACGALCTVALAIVLPRLDVHDDHRVGVRAALVASIRVLRHRNLAILCGVTIVSMVAHFDALTYLAPLLHANGGISGAGLSAVLLAFGLAACISTLAVARIIDSRAVLVMASGLGLCALAIFALAISRGPVLATVAVVLWGAAFAVAPVALQASVLRVVPGAQDAASAVYVVAFQIAISGGSLLGAALVDGGALRAVPFVAAALFAVATVGAVLARRVFAQAAPA